MVTVLSHGGGGKAINIFCFNRFQNFLKGAPFGIPILPALVLLVVYGCEINSCFNNYFEARGSKLRINIFKWLKNKSDIMLPSDDENNTTKT